MQLCQNLEKVKDLLPCSRVKIQTNLPEEEGSRISDKRKDEQPDPLYEGGDIGKAEWDNMSDKEKKEYVEENKEDI